MMSMATVDELIAQVLQLSPEDRARLVREVSDADAPDIEASWGEEVSRRAQEVLDGTAELLDWDDVKKRIEERREQRRRQR
ncbi:addiction module protein [Corallococcus coralloides]|uniref:addiction module protein n=1 Tax=Corallococcus coralloides TaxID=184914 RepID=UPI00030DE251|nr:addiction module protein [Corallococcus coralloides]